jgi:ribulose kinase
MCTTQISSPSVHPPGRPVGLGLSAQAAVELGLREGTPVAAGSIDAHAGVVGVLGARPKEGAAISAESMQSRLALILGTSSCHMALSSQMHLVPGVWGPYHSVVLPGMWLNEGGQSASGALLDHILNMHSGGALAKQAAGEAGTNVYAYLNDQATALARGRGLSDPLLLCRDLHVLDSFHGNRSPLANPHLTVRFWTASGQMSSRGWFF